VVGGGNTAVEETLYLSNLAEHVTLIHRRDRLRAEKILQDRLLERARAGKVSLVWHHSVDEILGDDSGVHSVRIRSTINDMPRDIAVTGIFIAIGHTPNTELFRGQLEMRGGYLSVHGGADGNATATSLPGVFCGRRRRRSHLPSGGHLGRFGLHGGARCRPLPRAVRSPARLTHAQGVLRASADPAPHPGERDSRRGMECAGGRLSVPATRISRGDGGQRLQQARSGWIPRHLVLLDQRGLSAAAPLYEKTHSWGEFVFDFAWARAAEQAGMAYYPKLVCAVPFTPATGPRLLCRADLAAAPLRLALLRAMRERLAVAALSSAHALFLDAPARAACEQDGWLLRRDCHFQWRNRGYRDFEDFLDGFRPTSARRRGASAAASPSRASNFARCAAMSSARNCSSACSGCTRSPSSATVTRRT